MLSNNPRGDGIKSLTASHQRQKINKNPKRRAQQEDANVSRVADATQQKHRASIFSPDSAKFIFSRSTTVRNENGVRSPPHGVPIFFFFIFRPKRSEREKKQWPPPSNFISVAINSTNGQDSTKGEQETFNCLVVISVIIVNEWLLKQHFLSLSFPFESHSPGHMS